MATFREADQARLQLKMKLSVFAWYKYSIVALSSENDGYSVIIYTKYIDDFVRKNIPPVVNGISIKTEIEKN